MSPSAPPKIALAGIVVSFGDNRVLRGVDLSVAAGTSTVLIGPDGKVLKHWKRVPKAEDHPAKVLEALQA